MSAPLFLLLSLSLGCQDKLDEDSSRSVASDSSARDSSGSPADSARPDSSTDSVSPHSSDSDLDYGEGPAGLPAWGWTWNERVSGPSEESSPPSTVLDAEETHEFMESLGASLRIVKAQTATEFAYLMESLEAAEGSDAQIMALLGDSPCSWTAEDWIERAIGEGVSCTEEHAEAILTLATTELAALSLSKPQLTGFAIDDTQQLLSDGYAGGALDRAGFGRVHAAWTAVNPELIFWPVTYVQQAQLGSLLSGGGTLTSLWANDFTAGSSLSWTMPLTAEGGPLRLRFVWGTILTESSQAGLLEASLWVNGEQLSSADLYTLDLDTPVEAELELDAGEHSLEIRLSAVGENSNRNAYLSGKLLRFWGLEIEGGEASVQAGSYTAVLPEGAEGRGQHSGEEHIEDFIGGLLVTSPPAVETAQQGDYVTLTELLARRLDEITYASMHYTGVGLEWEHSMDPAQLDWQLEVSSPLADAVVFWKLPVGLSSPRDGRFASWGQDQDGFTHTLYHPESITVYEGWASLYRSQEAGTEWSLSLREDVSTESGIGEALSKRVWTESGALLYEDLSGGVECSEDRAASSCPGWEDAGSCSWSCDGDREQLTIELEHPERLLVGLQSLAHFKGDLRLDLQLPDDQTWSHEAEVSESLEAVHALIESWASRSPRKP